MSFIFVLLLKIQELVKALSEDLNKRGKELIEFKTKYNIKLKGEQQQTKKKEENKQMGVLA